MRCERARLDINRALDGELPEREREVLAAHAAGCPQCAAYREDLLRMREQLTQARERAPAGLLDRIHANLELEATAQKRRAPTASSASQQTFGTFLRGLLEGFRPHLGAAAAVMLAFAIAVPGTWFYAQRVQTSDTVAQEALAAHVRSLLQDNAVQVASLDTHTVKPWFAGRIEYTPVVKDLTAEGFPLVGGRLDYVAGRRVATLVYRRRLHQISVFIWPSADSDPGATSRTTINGYNLVSWHRSGMTYWAVSDLNAGELGELEALL